MVSIIIPTYNEKENLPILIKQICQVGKDNFFLPQIWIIDDNSPDKTGQLADLFASQYPNIRVLHRPAKLGLGSAYVAGFKAALDQPQKPTHLITMDADLSHNPASLPYFLSAARKSHLVIGSRYVSGGQIEHWRFLRKKISRFGTKYARFFLKLPIQDLTSGYKCYHRGILEAVNFDQIPVQGYAFQIEMTWLAIKSGFTAREIPIIFYDRGHGKSKFSKKIILEAAQRVIALRRQKTS